LLLRKALGLQLEHLVRINQVYSEAPPTIQGCKPEGTHASVAASDRCLQREYEGCTHG